MENKKSDAIDPRNIPQTPNQENEVKQEGTFRNVKEGSHSPDKDKHDVKREDEITREPKKVN